MSNPLTKFLSTLGRSGGLGRPARAALKRASGFGQALTTSATVTAFLDDLTNPDVAVPYHERSELLGLGAFPLALDGDPHQEARDLIAAVLATSAGTHQAGVAAATDLARHRVATASDRVDLIGQVVDPALETWIETWYGLPDWGVRLMRAGRLILHATFLNPNRPNGDTDFAALRHAIETVDGIRAELVTHLRTTNPIPGGSVAAEMVSSTEDPDLAARHLLGLTVGPLALGSHAVANVLDELLGCSWKLDGLVPRPGENLAEARRRAQSLLGLTLARRPPLPGVARWNPAALDLVGANGRTVSVPRGDVLVATEAAMALDSLSPELAFGHGGHACMGRNQISEVAGAVLMAVAARSPRRIPGPAGTLANGPAPRGVARWPFPGKLDVSLLG